MNTVTISIGRNNGQDSPLGREGTPLVDSTWHGFVRYIDDVLARCDAEVHFRGYGASSDGEESHTWVASIDEDRVHYKAGADDIRTGEILRYILAEAARIYGQDCIAITSAPRTEFYGPHPWA